jgi:hypothetical protein
MDFGRPTNKGITMCGKTTTSLRGNKGRTRSGEKEAVMGIPELDAFETWG